MSPCHEIVSPLPPCRQYLDSVLVLSPFTQLQPLLARCQALVAVRWVVVMLVAVRLVAVRLVSVRLVAVRLVI